MVMEHLCERLATDLDGAFDDLVGSLGDDVYSGLRRMHGDDAADLTQETFIRAYRALLGYDSGRIRDLKLRPWLWTIAVNLCRNGSRSRSRAAVTVPLAGEDRAAVDTVDVAAEGIASVIADEWQQRLETLPEPQRNAIVLRHVVGLPYREIATALDRPVGTTKADVHRGLEQLRGLLAAEIEETS